MRTSIQYLHLPHHSSGWWIGHALLGLVLGAVLVYAASVLLVVALRLLA